MPKPAAAIISANATARANASVYDSSKRFVDSVNGSLEHVHGRASGKWHESAMAVSRVGGHRARGCGRRDQAIDHAFSGVAPEQVGRTRVSARLGDGGGASRRVAIRSEAGARGGVVTGRSERRVRERGEASAVVGRVVIDGFDASCSRRVRCCSTRRLGGDDRGAPARRRVRVAPTSTRDGRGRVRAEPLAKRS